MWIIIRLVLAAIGFVVRQWRHRPLGQAAGEHKGMPYFVRKRSTKKTVSLSIGMPLMAPTWIRMHRESALDKFFKRIGVANELTTGDPTFDERVYVTCDHPAVATLLAGAPELRAAILAAFAHGCQSVRYDGSMVWMERMNAVVASPKLLDPLLALQTASEPLCEEPRRWFADRFLWKALFVEGLIWSIAGYALGALLGYGVHNEDFHIWPSAVVWTGLQVALVALAALLGGIWLLMRGSSRGHRVVIESSIVLALGLPIAAIQAVGDSNRALDEAPARTLSVHASRCQVRTHGTRRKRYSYHALLTAEPRSAPDAPDAPAMPADIEVSPELCGAIKPGSELELELGPGRWGIPWYRRIRAGAVTWIAPR